MGHLGSPIFKGWKSSEEYHKGWLVQRYLLDTHPSTSTYTWTLDHITILPTDMLCLSPWYMGLEPIVMGRATWCAGVKMGTARSRFDGCLYPPVRTTKPSEKSQWPSTLCPENWQPHQQVAVLVEHKKGWHATQQHLHLPPSCGGWSETEDTEHIQHPLWVWQYAHRPDWPVYWDEDEITPLAYVAQTPRKICSDKAKL